MAGEDQPLHHQIAGVTRKASDLEVSLAAADKAGNGDEVKFLRDQLVQLATERLCLQERMNLLLRAQQGGYCSLLSVPTHFG